MIKLVDYQTENALPVEMKTAERIALSYAFDCQKKKYCERVSRACIWSNIDNVEDNKLDFLAVESRVMFYNSLMETAIKRNFISNYIGWYLKLGTTKAAEEVIDTYYPNDETKLIKWFEYDGEPFHFRIETTALLEEDCYADLKQMIFKVKNARSRLDQIRTMRCLTDSFSAVTATISRCKNPPVREGMTVTRLIENDIDLATNINIIQRQSIQ